MAQRKDSFPLRIAAFAGVALAALLIAVVVTLLRDGPEDREEDEQSKALRAFNGYLMMHPQLQAVVLPVGDGLGVATKTKPLIFEMGGPY